jgi:hypothetical protein
MASDLGSLTLTLDADNSDLKKAFSEAKSEINSFNSAVKSIEKFDLPALPDMPKLGELIDSKTLAGLKEAGSGLEGIYDRLNNVGGASISAEQQTKRLATSLRLVGAATLALNFADAFGVFGDLGGKLTQAAGMLTAMLAVAKEFGLTLGGLGSAVATTVLPIVAAFTAVYSSIRLIIGAIASMMDGFKGLEGLSVWDTIKAMWGKGGTTIRSAANWATGKEDVDFGEWGKIDPNTEWEKGLENYNRSMDAARESAKKAAERSKKLKESFDNIDADISELGRNMDRRLKFDYVSDATVKDEFNKGIKDATKEYVAKLELATKRAASALEFEKAELPFMKRTMTGEQMGGMVKQGVMGLASGRVGELAQAGAQGAQAGPWGAVLAVAAKILSYTQHLKTLMEIGEGIITQIVGIFDEIAKPMTGLVQATKPITTAILGIVSSLFKVVNALSGVGTITKIITMAAQKIADAIKWLVNGILDAVAWIVDLIPGLDDVAKEIRDAKMGAAAEEMKDAIEAFTGTLNAPQGFKDAYNRLQSIAADAAPKTEPTPPTTMSVGRIGLTKQTAETLGIDTSSGLGAKGGSTVGARGGSLAVAASQALGGASTGTGSGMFQGMMRNIQTGIQQQSKPLPVLAQPLVATPAGSAASPAVSAPSTILQVQQMNITEPVDVNGFIAAAQKKIVDTMTAVSSPAPASRDTPTSVPASAGTERSGRQPAGGLFARLKKHAGVK